MLDVMEGEAAGKRVSRWGRKSFLNVPWDFKELFLNQNKVACFIVFTLKKQLKSRR